MKQADDENPYTPPAPEPSEPKAWKLGLGSFKSHGGVSIKCAAGGVACYLAFAIWLFAPEATGFNPSPWLGWVPWVIIASYLGFGFTGVVFGLLSLVSVLRTRQITLVAVFGLGATLFCVAQLWVMFEFLRQ